MAAASGHVEAMVEAVFREEWGRIVASLIATTGDWDLAEECAQDAFARALQAWDRDGVPAHPGAWLTTVARNRAVDVLRRRANETVKLQQALLLSRAEEPPATQAGDIADDRLRLIFTCCHPALPLEARVALTLRTLAGLTTAEIARAFLVSEPSHGPAAGPGETEDPQGADTVPGTAGQPAARTPDRRARGPVPAVQRGLHRIFAVLTWSARSCPLRPSG